MGNLISSERLDLVLLTRGLIDELWLEPDADRTVGGVLVPAGWPDEHDARFLRLRRDQIERNPADEPFLARMLVLRGEPARPVVGHAGFHERPRDGSLEIGYTVFPRWRGLGLAKEAVRALMDWAASEHGVRRFIASISPRNAPSLALARKLGFRRTGQQMDEEDGLEWVFELRLVN